MLESCADILKKLCGKEDLIARWGGDEFLSYYQLQQICNRIDNSCTEEFFHVAVDI